MHSVLLRELASIFQESWKNHDDVSIRQCQTALELIKQNRNPRHMVDLVEKFIMCFCISIIVFIKE